MKTAVGKVRIIWILLGVFVLMLVLYAIADIWFGMWVAKLILDGIVGFFKMF